MSAVRKSAVRVSEGSVAFDTPAAVDTTDRPAWRMAASIEMAVLLGLVIATIGTLTSRVDVVLIALPLLASAAIGFDRRPVAGAHSRLRVDVARRTDAEGASVFAYRVSIEAPPHTELVHLRMSLQGAHAYELIVAPGDVA